MGEGSVRSESCVGCLLAERRSFAPPPFLGLFGYLHGFLDVFWFTWSADYSYVKQARKEQESGWSPKWFEQRGPHGTYCYKGGYWEAREKKEWTGIPDIYNIDELEIAK